MTQPQTAALQQEVIRRKQATFALIAVFTTFFAASYFFRGSSVTLPRIAAELNGMSLYSWALSLPGLASAFATLLFGKLSDMYGRRVMLLISLALYGGGAVLAALSQDFVFFIAARVIISFGQGTLAPLCFSVIGDLYSPAERSKWSGLLQIPAGISAIVVPWFVGMLTDQLSWRYFLWVAVMLVIVSGVLVLTSIPSLSKRTEHKIDFSGSCALAVAISSMILGFSWAGSLYSWTSPWIIGLFAASAVAWIVFVRIEGGAKEPMLDLQVLTNRTFLIAAVSALLSYFSLLGITMYFVLFLQGVQGMSATWSALFTTPFVAFMTFVGVPTGIVLSRTKRYKAMYIIGYGVLTAAACVMVLFTEGTPLWVEILVIAVAGIGLGAIPTINTLVAQFALPKRLLGVAVGAMFFFVFLGNAVGPAILGSAMNAKYEKTLGELLPPELSTEVDQATLESLADSRILLSAEAMDKLRKTFERIDGGETLLDRTVKAIRDSLEAALRLVFLIGAVATFLSFLLIITIPEVPIDAEVEDKRRR